MGIWLLFFIVGGLMFIYFNIKACLKLNLAASFINIYIYIVLFKKKYALNKRIFYIDFANKLIARYRKTESVNKLKKYLKYLKYVKKLPKLFIIKNIHLYPEYFDDLSSFTVEFIVVNNVLKKSLLNG